MDKRFNRIHLIVYDFDGVMTDNRVLVSEDGTESVMVNRSDGLAVGNIRALGIRQIIITTEENNVVEARARKLSVPLIKGTRDKKAALMDYCKANDIDMSSVAYIGNDINDLDAMKCVGLPACPSDACDEIKSISKLVIRVPGGRGVVREFLDHIRDPGEDR